MLQAAPASKSHWLWVRGRVLGAHCVMVTTGASAAHVAVPGGGRLTLVRAARPATTDTAHTLETGPGSRGAGNPCLLGTEGHKGGVSHRAPQHDELQLQSLSSSPGPEL